MHNPTSVERHLDEHTQRMIERTPTDGLRRKFVELLAFVVKQAWACIFGALMLAVIFAARLWYPEDAALARNDFLTLCAIAIQVAMVATKLETTRELRVIVLFHVVGTVMEIFKTDVGSWSYEATGFLRVGAVPLFSGFMYASVGSYMVRVYRLFDLRFTRYPRHWVTVVLAVGIYINFFTHHYFFDFRWVLLAAVVLVYGHCTMHFRVFRRSFRMPLSVSFVLVALFIWVAENLATWSHAWLYPNQMNGWHIVSPEKVLSWFLLMIISVVLVAWEHKPLPPNV